MISKAGFVKIMKAIDDYFDNVNKLDETLGVSVESFLYQDVDKVLDVICEEFLGDKARDAYYECFYDFVLNKERDKTLRVWSKNSWNDYTIRNFEELYDVLVTIKYECFNGD